MPADDSTQDTPAGQGGSGNLCSPVEPALPEIAVSVVVESFDELLLIRRGHGPAGGRWSLPGGRVERGETVAEAAVRELREETGLAGVCGELIGVVEVIEDHYHVVILCHEATVLNNTEPAASSDAAEARWVLKEEISDLLLTDGLAEFLHCHGYLSMIA
jgi:8-oxo-dGTP diphosphatase